MSAAPDPAELAPSRDPAAYGRRRILSPAFWAMISLAVLCVLAGAAIVGLAPRFLRRPASAPPAPAAANSSEPVAAPAVVLPAAPPATTAVPAPEIAALQGRVERLELGEARLTDAAAAALAAAAVSQAAQAGSPFAGELAAYQRVLPGSAAARALAPLATQGAPPRVALAAQLSDIAPAVATAARAPPRHASVIQEIIYAVSKVVTIRPIDERGTGPDADLARAERRAQGGDLEGALDSLRGLPPSATGPLRSWRAQAERRIAIDRGVAALRAEALADLETARESG